MKVVKLKEVANIYDGIHETPNYKPSGVRFVSVEDIKNLYHSNKYISILDYDKLYTIKPEYNDILMTRIGDIGTPAICNKEEPLAYYVSLALIKPININTDYLYFALQSQLFKKESYKRTIHVAFPKKINLSEIGECLIPLLENNIQTKIATFLNLYYKKIELQKKKIDLLHNMFKWVAKINLDINKEEIYIENLVEEFIEKSHTENQYPVLSSTMNGIFLQNEYFTDNVITQSNIGYKIVPYNYFTYRSMSDTGKFVFNVQRLVDKGIVSPAYPVFNVNEKCLSDFLYYYLNYSKYIKKQLLLLKEGGTRYALGFEKFKKLKVVCLTLEEQQVIVKNLDLIKSKLELEKQKLEAMEKYKQGLLQQLFV